MQNTRSNTFIFMLGLLSFVTVSCNFSSLKELLDGKISVTGRVADGYLRNAKVFFDCNANNILDEQEASTVSTAGGLYEFTDLSSNSIKNCKLVADASAKDQVIDEDDMLDGRHRSLAEAGREGFILSAPAGKHDFISPLTTLAEEHSGTLESLASSLDLLDTEELFRNYIDKDSRTEIRQKAKLLTYLLADAKTANPHTATFKKIVSDSMQKYQDHYRHSNFGDLAEIQEKIAYIKQHTAPSSKPDLPNSAYAGQNIIQACEAELGISINILDEPGRDQRNLLGPSTTMFDDSRLKNGWYVFREGQTPTQYTYSRLAYRHYNAVMIGQTMYPASLAETESNELYAKKTIAVRRTSLIDSSGLSVGDIVAAKCGDLQTKDEDGNPRSISIYAYQLHQLPDEQTAYITDRFRDVKPKTRRGGRRNSSQLDNPTSPV